MDFMFEDEVDEVGSDVEAYCPKCKGDTTHVVISKYEDEIRRVQCNPCGDVHSFRKPRGDVEDDVPEPIAAKKRAMMKKPTFDEFFAKHSDKNAKPYEFREHYHENVIVTHPKFGKGFVSEICPDSKVEVTFKDSRRVLVHNRKNMPGLPLAAEGDGIASNTKITKKRQAGQPRSSRPRPPPKEAGRQGAASQPAGQAARQGTAKPARAPARVRRRRPVEDRAGRQGRQAHDQACPSRQDGGPAARVPPPSAPPRPPSAARSRGLIRAARGAVRACSRLADEEDVEVVEGVRVDGDGEAAEPVEQAEAAARQHAEHEHRRACSGSP